jgi:uncharacterized RDD family membrane protein YckC
MTDRRPESGTANADLPTAGVVRRLAAALYDILIVAGVLFFAAFPLPMIPEDLRASFGVRLLIQAYLLGIVVLYFAGLWVHGGQTVGMRAWRLRVVDRVHGRTPGWATAGRRLLLAAVSWAPAAAGVLWAWIDRDGLAWHDRLTGTRLVVVPVPPPKRRAAADHG